jgi:hypothetical protein
MCTNGDCKCPVGFETCNGTCVNVLQDDQNCGMCGKICAGFQICRGGRCEQGGDPDGGTRADRNPG